MTDSDNGSKTGVVGADRQAHSVAMSKHQTHFAGPPVRQSRAVDAGDPSRRRFEGIVKFRLAHSEGRSYLIPDVLIGVGGTRFFIPSNFGPPLFTFDSENGRHHVAFSLDTGPPRVTEMARIVVFVRSEDRIRTYDDGAQLYRCAFEGPRLIARAASGLCHRRLDGDYALRLYHHTRPESARAIRGSRNFWSSPWNLAGTRRLVNVAYAYFTTLPQIAGEADLHRIAMASDGRIMFQTTSDRPLEKTLVLQVYRGDTRDRTAALAFEVPAALLAPAHLLFHPMSRGQPAYFEVIGPEIARVGVEPGASLALADGQVSATDADRKAFDTLILGDASTVEGLAAPYDEEDTRQVAHLEPLIDQDVFAFWLEHQNRDLVTGRAFEPRRLEPLPGDEGG